MSDTNVSNVGNSLNQKVVSAITLKVNIIISDTNVRNVGNSLNGKVVPSSTLQVFKMESVSEPGEKKVDHEITVLHGRTDL